jgi:hypothetical protein
MARPDAALGGTHEIRAPDVVFGACPPGSGEVAAGRGDAVGYRGGHGIEREQHGGLRRPPGTLSMRMAQTRAGAYAAIPWRSGNRPLPEGAGWAATRRVQALGGGPAAGCWKRTPPGFSVASRSGPQGRIAARGPEAALHGDWPDWLRRWSDLWPDVSTARWIYGQMIAAVLRVLARERGNELKSVVLRTGVCHTPGVLQNYGIRKDPYGDAGRR